MRYNLVVTDANNSSSVRLEFRLPFNCNCTYENSKWWCTDNDVVSYRMGGCTYAKESGGPHDIYLQTVYSDGQRYSLMVIYAMFDSITLSNSEGHGYLWGWGAKEQSDRKLYWVME